MLKSRGVSLEMRRFWRRSRVEFMGCDVDLRGKDMKRRGVKRHLCISVMMAKDLYCFCQKSVHFLTLILKSIWKHTGRVPLDASACPKARS